MPGPGGPAFRGASGPFRRAAFFLTVRTSPLPLPSPPEDEAASSEKPSLPALPADATLAERHKNGYLLLFFLPQYDEAHAMSSRQIAPSEPFRATIASGRTNPARSFRPCPAAAPLLRALNLAAHASPAALPWLFCPEKTARYAHVRIRKGRTIFRTATEGSRPAEDRAALFRPFRTEALPPHPCRASLPSARRPEEGPATLPLRPDAAENAPCSRTLRKRSSGRRGMPKIPASLSTPPLA